MMFRMMVRVRTNGCAGGLLCRPGSSNCLQVLTLPCNEEYILNKVPNDHIERVEPLENGRTLEGSDMLQVFCIATTEAEAEGVVFKILQTGITCESIFVVTGCSEMDQSQTGQKLHPVVTLNGQKLFCNERFRCEKFSAVRR